MRDCLDRGEAPFASHGLYTQPGVLDDWDPAEREKGILAGFEWRLVAQATIVYADRGITPGMRAGIRKATDLQSHGTFDHYVEYRFLSGEWSALGGPEEIRKHLDDLLYDDTTKHRHLAIVSGPASSPRHVQMISTPAELSMAHVSVVKKVESPTGPSGLEEQSPDALGQLRGHPVSIDDIEDACTVGAGVPSRSYTRDAAQEAAAQAQLDRISEATRFAQNRMVKSAENFGGEFGEGESLGGHGAQTDDYGMEYQDAPDGQRPLTMEEVRDLVKKGGEERAEAEKTIKRPPRH